MADRWLQKFKRSQLGPVVNIGKGDILQKGIQWKGLDKVMNNLNKEAAKIGRTSVKNLLIAGLLVKGKAQKIVPVDTANLKASAYVVWGGGGSSVNVAPPRAGEGRFKDEKKTKSSSLSGRASKIASQHQAVINIEKKASLNPFATIGFTAFYALFVHEDLTASHVKTATSGDPFGGGRKKRNVQIGQAKFLEQSLLQNHAKILSILRGGIQK